MCTRYEKGIERDPGLKILEVVMVKKNPLGGEQPKSRYVMVDAETETLRFVQENMDRFIGNVMRVRRIEERERKERGESESLFARDLGPLFDLLANSGDSSIMKKMSSSLKRALILMAMKKYGCDERSICQVFGITREKLESEMSACGLTLNERRLSRT